MDQSTARRLAKVMCDEGTGAIFVAMTDYAHRGQFDEPDAVWGVMNVGLPKHLIMDMAAVPEFAEKVNPGMPKIGARVDPHILVRFRKYRIEHTLLHKPGKRWSCFAFLADTPQGPKFSWEPSNIVIPSQTILGVYQAHNEAYTFMAGNDPGGEVG